MEDLLRLLETLAKNDFSWINESIQVSREGNGDCETIKALMHHIINLTQQIARVYRVCFSPTTSLILFLTMILVEFLVIVLVVVSMCMRI